MNPVSISLAAGAVVLALIWIAVWAGCEKPKLRDPKLRRFSDQP